MNQEYWKVLKVPLDTSIATVLETWYLSFGDLVYSPFSHVLCVNVKKDKIPRQCDLDPYEYYLVLFYELKPLFRECCILGTKTWDKLEEEGCYERSVSFLMPYVEDDNCFEKMPNDEEETSLPIELPFDEDKELKVSFEVCLERACSYVTKKKKKKPVGGSTVSVFTRLVYHFIKNPELKLRYAYDRLETEKMNCQEQLRDASEVQVLDILFKMGIDNYLSEAMIVSPTILDKQCFYRRFGPGVCPPKFAFRVPMEEVPGNLVKKIPMYEYGIAHLTYKDCCDWVCNVLEIQSKHNASLSSGSVILKDEDQNERLALTANVVVGLYSKFPSLVPLKNLWKKKKNNNNKEHYSHAIVPPPSTGGFDVDVFDLELIVPPCFRQVMTAKRFPRHWERLFILTTLRAAGISMETVGDWLEEKNRKYPKESGVSTLARFNYENEWNNNVSEIYCKTIFKNTRKNMTERICCPFLSGGGGGGGEDIEDLCKQKCMPNDTVPFNGPKNVIKRLRYRHNNNKSNAVAAVGASTM